MILSHYNKQLKLPDFLIIGAARSGTTALYSALDRHPQVFMPEEKEPLFFCSYGKARKKTIAAGKLVDNWQNYNIDQYAAIFDSAEKEQLLGEASSHYLYEYLVSIDNIKKIYQDDAKKLKIIILLRNPADRAWSHHLLRTTNHSEILPFPEAISPEVVARRLEMGMLTVFDYVGYGLYANQVKEWQKHFPFTRIWIYEEFFTDLDRYMVELTDFLGIRPNKCLTSLKRINSSGVARNQAAQFFINRLQKPERWKDLFKKIMPQKLRQDLKRKASQKLLQRQSLDPDLRQQLLKHYRDDVKRLEVVLNRNLDIWMKTENSDNCRIQT